MNLRAPCKPHPPAPMLPALWAAVSLLLASPAAAEKPAPAPGDEAAFSAPCRTREGLGVLISPAQPIKGEPLRVVVVSSRPGPGARLLARGPAGKLSLEGELTRGGPPYWWFGALSSPGPGAHRFVLVSPGGEVLACGRATVREDKPAAVTPPAVGAWPVRRSWNRQRESLYAAWIEKLFDAPPTESPSWTPLHLVLRDPARNLLYNHLGAGEDGPDPRTAVVARPDCADMPYFLRAYFSWKMRLPFGYRHCDRGSSTRATHCGPLRSVISDEPPLKTGPPARRFSEYIRRKVGLVHSGAGRTAPDDDETDLFPVKLTREDLRPGTVYVDPYGHLLVVARWINQTADASGQLFAVDGHPDLSVGRKRFWRGAFLFSDNVQGGAGGFKAFRPLVVKGGTVTALTNEEIRASKDYGNHSGEQYGKGIDSFYDRMDRVINPRPLSPLSAHNERLKALYELILERVGSVAAGEEYMKNAGYRTVKMPAGPRIFETAGPWEDFSTPARDFRLLIAIDEVLGFPAKVMAQPGRYAFPPDKKPEAVRAELLAQEQAFTREKKFTYVKSDGSDKTLAMADLLARQKGLEVAYNPNDCVELRWGAAGEELQTCKRRAPADQQELMQKYRSWFATRNRPPLR